MVKCCSQLADFVVRLDIQPVAEITRRYHLRTSANIFNRCGDGLGQQKTEHDRHQQSEHHSAQHDAEKIPRQVAHFAFVVEKINDVLWVLSLLVERQRNGIIHIAVNRRVRAADFTIHRGNDIGRAGQLGGARLTGA